MTKSAIGARPTHRDNIGKRRLYSRIQGLAAFIRYAMLFGLPCVRAERELVTLIECYGKRA